MRHIPMGRTCGWAGEIKLTPIGAELNAWRIHAAHPHSRGRGEHPRVGHRGRLRVGERRPEQALRPSVHEPRVPAHVVVAKKSGRCFRVGITLDSVRLTTRTMHPHGAHVRGAELHQVDVDPRWGGGERLASRTRSRTRGSRQSCACSPRRCRRQAVWWTRRRTTARGCGSRRYRICQEGRLISADGGRAAIPPSAARAFTVRLSYAVCACAGCLKGATSLQG